MASARGGARDDVRLCSEGASFTIRVPNTDIDKWIRISPWRSFFTIFAIALAVTDIPRTGLTFRMRDYYSERVAPNAVKYWGPYEYHVARILATDDHPKNAAEQLNVTASRSGAPLGALEVWAYKHDTLSIAPRAVALHLNVSSYPECVMYREPCVTSTLDLATVFRMSSDLVAAVQHHWFPKPSDEARPFVFFAKSNWVDRLNHILVQPLTKNPENRFHAAYHISPSRHKHGWDPRHLCDHAYVPFAMRSRPVICDHPAQWRCDHPINATGKRDVPIWDHIGLRFDHLSRQHPDLQLDFTMLVSNFAEQTHPDRHVLPSVNYLIDTIEVTTLIRGRRCDAHSLNCRTVLLDDYRYERSAVQSDEDEWRDYLRILRGVSQFYVWLRVGLLIWGCVHARKTEAKLRHRPLLSVLRAAFFTLLRIPGHTIVYGSWLPIIGYAVAHWFDASVVHFVIEFQWSSIGGFFDFDPIEYIIAASVQMRNIWMIAIVWKTGLFIADFSICGRNTITNPSFEGVLAIQGGWIGLVSWLTTFGLARALSFRDTNVISITELPRDVPLNVARSMETSRNYADKGVRLDLKGSLAACVLVAAVGCFVKIIVRTLTGRGTNVFVCRSFYVPFGAGILWPWSCLHTVWGFKFQAPRSDTRTWPLGPAPSDASSHSEELPSSPLPPPKHLNAPSTPPVVSGNPSAGCTTCNFFPSAIHWRSVQGCILHEPIFDIHRRTTAIWSMVRLTNIAHMTDPLVLFRLCVIGQPLFVYQISPNGQPPYLILLPMRPNQKDRLSADGHQSLKRPIAFECVGTVNSRDVPWHVLVQCG